MKMNWLHTPTHTHDGESDSIEKTEAKRASSHINGYSVHIKKCRELIVDLFTEVYLIPELGHRGQTLIHGAGSGDGCS